MALKERFIPLQTFPINSEDIEKEAQSLKKNYQRRRSCRHFADQPVPQSVIETLIEIAASAPSGANKQPWHFVAVSCKNTKAQIREAAEAEEKLFYSERAPKEWLEDLAPLGTDWEKEFLTTAPWLIIVFKEIYGKDESGEKNKHYYVNESVGIASGFLISAIHQLGLVTLTHTPSPMNFLSKILERPENEKPFLLLPVGYPAKDAMVPNISKKSLAENCTFLTD